MQNSSDNALPEEIQCPDCGADLQLGLRERSERKFTCPECHEAFVVKDNEMFCPICKAEFVEGITECSDCKVPLVASVPGESEAQNDPALNSANLVTVFVPESEADHLAIGALLQSAGIEFHSKNARVQNLFGMGQLGTGFNVAAGPVQMQVLEGEFEKAKELIDSYFLKQEDKIPKICPACDTLTQDLPQCPQCGLTFVAANSIEQNEIVESASDGNRSKRPFGPMISVVSGLVLGIFSYLATFNPSLVAPYLFLFNLRQVFPISSMIQPDDDRNDDGVPDHWTEYSGGKIVKSIFDLNFDGTPDMWEYYENGSIVSNESDRNFDGSIDRLVYYQAGLFSRAEFDRNYDGKYDSWEYYDASGEINEVHYDDNFDGQPELWEVYKNGVAIKYTADNDYDGKVDEWAVLEHRALKERRWSFRNDEIVDKKAVYENGRKTSEAYDRDRDGEFDETIFLDEFERVIRVVKSE